MKTARDGVTPLTDFAPGTMGCHEAMHMASFLANAVDEELCDHPAIEQNAEWQQLARAAQTALGDLYQAIGKEGADGRGISRHVKWWAMREIEKLREALVDIADPTTTAEERRQIACDALGWKTDQQ